MQYNQDQIINNQRPSPITKQKTLIIPHKIIQINPPIPPKTLTSKTINGKKSFQSKPKTSQLPSSWSNRVSSPKTKISNFIVRNPWCNKLPKRADNYSSKRIINKRQNSSVKHSWPLSSSPKIMPRPSKSRYSRKWWYKRFYLHIITWRFAT